MKKSAIILVGAVLITQISGLPALADWEPADLLQSSNLVFVITGGAAECVPAQDGSACIDVDCSNPGDSCQPICVQADPLTEKVIVLECACLAPDTCHVDMTVPYSGCVVPDNGSGTADLPPVGCEYVDPYEDWMIIDGLPPGTTIEMDGILMDFINITTGSGGSLGGEYEQFEATLDLTVRGTGDLEGFSRHLAVPVTCETHSAPRNPGDPVQSFATVLYQMQGQLFGDPDFCELIVRAGTNLGLPSPGQTTLSELPSGDFAVESFFDVTYQVEFEGCPGSQLQDYSGITTGTIRIRMGAEPPVCAGDCLEGETCVRTITDIGDGTVSVCCQCMAECDCQPGDPDNSNALNIGDAVYIITYIFKGGPPPQPYLLCSGDANCDCTLNIGDAVYMVSYIFKGGPPPCECAAWVTECGLPVR